MDAEIPDSLAGVVRLLRRADALAWQQVGNAGPGSARQVLAVGIDIVADEAALLLPAHAAEGPVPDTGTTRRGCCAQPSSCWPG